MGWDLFGQFVGKNRRRQLENNFKQDAAKVVKVDWGVLGTRLAAGAATGLLTATLSHGLPTTAGAVLTLAAGGMVAAGPGALQASGLVRAVSPDTLSLAQAAGGAISTFLSAPQAQRKQEITAIATQAALQAVAEFANKTGSFAPSELGQAEAAQAPQYGAGSAVGAATSISDTDPAIAATGGTQ